MVGATGLDALEHAFDAAKNGGIAPEPLLEVTIPSLVDSSLAPDGKHVMSVIVQYAPYHLAGSGWDAAARDRLGAIVLAALERVAPGIGRLVEAQQIITPADLERDYRLTEGHPMHGEQTLDQWFAWRPLLGHARYRLGGIGGLYLCASGAHPGGGITGSPGANAAGEIIGDLKRRRLR
jgi:phytoene dehydrogenase-like protein